MRDLLVALRTTSLQSSRDGSVNAHDAEGVAAIKRDWLDHYTVAHFAVFGDVHRLLGLFKLLSYD